MFKVGNGKVRYSSLMEQVGNSRTHCLSMIEQVGNSRRHCLSMIEQVGNGKTQQCLTMKSLFGVLNDLYICTSVGPGAKKTFMTNFSSGGDRGSVVAIVVIDI